MGSFRRGQWRKTIELGNLLDPNENLTLVERALGIDKAFYRAGLYRTFVGEDLLTTVEDLKYYATLGDPDIFDVAMGRIYDWCDRERVWLESYRTRDRSTK